MNLKSNIKSTFEYRLANNNKTMWALTARHLRMFFKNKMTFFFSLLVPVITIIIYILFLRGLEFQSVDSILANYFEGTIDPGLVTQAHGLVDSWMLSGIIAVSCITVSLNTCFVMIIDKESGANRDFASAPISRAAIITSYFVFNFIVTFIINFIVLVICIIYLGASGSFFLSISAVLGVVGVMLVSIAVSSLLTLFITSFINSGPVFNSIIAIMSAAIGFLIGAYMPITMLPLPVQYICGFFPGTYSAGLLRNLFLQDQFIHLTDYMNSIGVAESTINQITADLSTNFSLNVSFCGAQVSFGYMFLALLCFFIIFFIFNLIFANHNMTTSLLGRKKRKRKNVKLKTSEEKASEEKANDDE